MKRIALGIMLGLLIASTVREDCPQCGYDEQNCRCDDDDFMDELDCMDCHGEGWLWGEDIIGYDPLWHIPDKAYTCSNCGGSGLRRDQRVF